MSELMDIKKELDLQFRLFMKFADPVKYPDIFRKYEEAHSRIHLHLSHLTGDRIDDALVALEQLRLRAWGKESADSVIRTCESRVAECGGYLERAVWLQKLAGRIK